MGVTVGEVARETDANYNYYAQGTWSDVHPAWERGDQRDTKVPDIIEFTFSDQYLNKPTLYPRQATALKVMALQPELFTDFDWHVLGEWTNGFKYPTGVTPNVETQTLRYEGEWGINPDVIERMAVLKEWGHRWFSVVCAVQGRRSGKGHLGAIMGAYVLWNYICTNDPKGWYGVDPTKRLSCQVFAGKKAQARDNQWRDIANAILAAPCFDNFRSQSLVESMTLLAPQDRDRASKLHAAGRESAMDIASFEIVPKEATTMAARGPASFMQYYDEMAHMVNTGVSRSAEEVWNSATPALDQFKQDGFIYCGSSPWAMQGKFYELVQNSLEFDAETHQAVDPTILTLQLASWDIYDDYQLTQSGMMEAAPYRMSKCRAAPKTITDPITGKEVGVLDENLDNVFESELRPPIYFTPLRSAIQEYDAKMQREERLNPDTFRVERRCLDPDTRVLTENLDWVRIDDLEPGQRLVALDEEPPGDGKQRKMRTDEVVAKWDTEDDAYEIAFTDGTSVVCSSKHRWLSGGAGSKGSYRWRHLFADPSDPGPRQIIKPGDEIAFMCEPWEFDESREAGYLAGVYDGEGTAIGYKRREFRVSFVQNPGEVLDRTLSALHERGFTPRYMPVEGKRAQAWVIQGLPEVLRFVGSIGGDKIRRQAIPAMWEDRGLGRIDGKTGHKVVASITPVGRRRLVDVETTTGTFVAEGLISHNSKWATAQDAYFDPAHIDRAFMDWNGIAMEQKDVGQPGIYDYIAHADPGKTGSNFGFSICHVVPDPDGSEIPHVVFDRVHAWSAGDFPTYLEGEDVRYEMDYEKIEEDMRQWGEHFLYSDLSFDQWNSISFVQRLGRFMNEISYKPSRVWERTTTAPLNWTTAETMKVALALNRVHMPYYELADLEMKFLRKLPSDKVDHPDTGPVTTKDVYDTISICIHKAIGGQIATAYGEQFSSLRLGTAMPGLMSRQSGHTAFDTNNSPIADEAVHSMFGRRSGGRSALGDQRFDPARRR